MLEAYRQHVAERAALGVPPKPLDEAQVAALVELLKNPPKGEEDVLVDLLENRIPPGVDPAAYVKAGFLAAIATGKAESPLISKQRAVYLLGKRLYSCLMLSLRHRGKHQTRVESFSAQRKLKPATSTPKASCNHGPTANGSPTALMLHKKSPSPCSK